MFQVALPRFFAQVLFFIGVSLCLLPSVSGGFALLLGVILALSVGNPFLKETQKYTSNLLQISVVGLGAGMNLDMIANVGLAGVGYTAAGIVLGVGSGLLLGRLLRTNPNTSLLLSVGTAICGGSAIAAVAPVIRAKSDEISVSLATVFFLNASALFLFPPIGHWLQLSEHAFGMWSALAIHDTSSVVGAAMQYGSESVHVATTVKLARALWIIPISIVVGIAWNKGGSKKVQAKKPWFILGFLLAAALVTWIPVLEEPGAIVSGLAKKMLVVTLFLIGASLTLSTIRNVGLRPFVQGFCLWVITAAATLWAIQIGWIS